MKVATNIVTAATAQVAAEALALVRKAGISAELFARAMKSNASNSATLEMKVPMMIAGDFEPHFSVKHMLKDVRIGLKLARKLCARFAGHGSLRRHAAGRDEDRVGATPIIPPSLKNISQRRSKLEQPRTTKAGRNAEDLPSRSKQRNGTALHPHDAERRPQREEPQAAAAASNGREAEKTSEKKEVRSQKAKTFPAESAAGLAGAFRLSRENA